MLTFQAQNPSEQDQIAVIQFPGLLMQAFKDHDITINAQHYRETRTLQNFVSPIRESILPCSWRAPSCITMPVPMWPLLPKSCCIPCTGRCWTIPIQSRPVTMWLPWVWPLWESAEGLQIKQRHRCYGGTMVQPPKGFLYRGDI